MNIEGLLKPTNYQGESLVVAIEAMAGLKEDEHEETK